MAVFVCAAVDVIDMLLLCYLFLNDIQLFAQWCLRAELGQDGLEKEEVKEELSKSRKQIEDSRLRLTKLQNDGFDLVTSIRVAGDARENVRRVDEEEAKRIRVEKLEAEAKAGQERFEEVIRLITPLVLIILYPVRHCKIVVPT